MTGPEILLHTGPDEVVEALAARLMARLTEIQRDFRVPQVALTGGRIATRAYQRLGDEDRTLPSTGHESSSGGETSDSCPPTIQIGTPSRPLMCLPSRWS
jgi:hypothetical protein